MGTAHSYARRYFTSGVSRTAGVLLILGIVVALISTDYKRESVNAYFQSLSTGLIGIALTVWLVNFLLEYQSHRLSSELRASTEIAALFRLQRVVHRLPQWLPKVEAPDGTHWQQIEWVHNQINHMCALCDGMIAGPTDPELQQSLTSFKLAQHNWSDALEALAHLIHMTAPAKDRTPAFTALRDRTDRLRESASELAGILLKRHEHQKLVLGITRD